MLAAIMSWSLFCIGALIIMGSMFRQGISTGERGRAFLFGLALWLLALTISTFTGVPS